MAEADVSIEWAIRYAAGGEHAFQLCEDLDAAVQWRWALPQPNEIVCRVVTRSPWEVAKPVVL